MSVKWLLPIMFSLGMDVYAQPLNVRLKQALPAMKAYADSINSQCDGSGYRGRISHYVPCLELFLFPECRNPNGDSTLSEARFLSEWCRFVYMSMPGDDACWSMYERVYWDSILHADSLQLISENTSAIVSKWNPAKIAIQEFAPDAIFRFYFLYFGDSVNYWNPEDYSWWNASSRPKPMPVALRKPVVGKKGRKNRYPFVLEDPTLIVTPVSEWWLVLKGDSLFAVNLSSSGDFEKTVNPVQTFLDAICPSFVARLNSLTGENFIPESERKRMALAANWYWMPDSRARRKTETKGRMIVQFEMPWRHSQACR